MSVEVSLIITTYNWPEALGAVLDSVARQNKLPLEVVIADDGSTDDTRRLIERYQQDFPCPILHIWHYDHGYQAAQIRNKAVAKSKGDFLIFIDSDCLMRPDFIEQHTRLAETGHFVAGNRVLLSENYTNQVLEESIDVCQIRPFDFSSGQVNRRWSLLPIPLGIFRRIQPGTWKGVKACNMSMYTSDFITANGFEEEFEGWGYEDSELIIRLQKKGIKRISGRFAVTVLHLWHASNKSNLKEGNWQRLQNTLNGNRTTANRGIDQHISPT